MIPLAVLRKHRIASTLFALLAIVLLASNSHAQTVRVLKFSEAKPFHMGGVTSMRIVQPDVGAKKLTLNYSTSQPGREFSQHVHDYSDDTMLVLQGAVDLRQGDSRKPIGLGRCAFVPAGQIHGTITTAPDTVMISFQVPPDLVLYTGARDSSKAGAPPPNGVITPGAVKFFDFAHQNGFFISPKLGAPRAAAAHRTLQPGEGFSTSVGPDGEQLLFVWKGEIRVRHEGTNYVAAKKDTVFTSGPADLDVRSNSAQPTVVIQIQAPAGSGW